MNDTPRTDAKAQFFGFNPDEGEEFVQADFARELERENAALREALEWIAKRGWDPEGTTIDNANLAYESCCEARSAIDAARKAKP